MVLVLPNLLLQHDPLAKPTAATAITFWRSPVSQSFPSVCDCAKALSADQVLAAHITVSNRRNPNRDSNQRDESQLLASAKIQVTTSRLHSLSKYDPVPTRLSHLRSPKLLQDRKYSAAGPLLTLLRYVLTRARCRRCVARRSHIVRLPLPAQQLATNSHGCRHYAISESAHGLVTSSATTNLVDNHHQSNFRAQPKGVDAPPHIRTRAHLMCWRIFADPSQTSITN